MAGVVFDRVNKRYGAAEVIRQLSLEVGDREFMVLVGPSGCGKTTLLRLIAGLEETSGGQIRISGRVVNGLPPQDRDIAMVFQNSALYPHMSVRENMDFGLRVQMRAEITRLQHRLQTTTVYVTHDQVEAMTMGHRIAVLDQGEIQQVGTPRELYQAPANLRVARFIGSAPMNIVRGFLSPDGARVTARGFELPLSRSQGRAARVPTGPGHAGGDEVDLLVDLDRLHLFDPSTGRCLTSGV